MRYSHKLPGGVEIGQLLWKALELFLTSDPRNLPQENAIWNEVALAKHVHPSFTYSSKNLETV